MNSGPRPVNNLLHTASSDFGLVVRHAQYLRRLQNTVICALPEAAATHVHVAGLHDTQLLIHTDNTGWATRLRYAEPGIRRALAQRMRLHVDRIRVRVRPGLAQSQTLPVERHISTANRDYMRSVAGYIGDTDLARALLALADASEDSGDSSP